MKNLLTILFLFSYFLSNSQKPDRNDSLHRKELEKRISAQRFIEVDSLFDVNHNEDGIVYDYFTDSTGKEYVFVFSSELSKRFLIVSIGESKQSGNKKRWKWLVRNAILDKEIGGYRELLRRFKKGEVFE